MLVLFDVLKDVLCLVSQLNEDDIVGAEIVLESNKGCVGVEAELGDGNFLRQEDECQKNNYYFTLEPSMSRLQNRLLWATRTALASGLTFLLLIANNQSFLPIPVLGVVYAIVICEASFGKSLLTFKALLLSSLWGILCGGLVSNLLRLIFSTETFAILLPPTVMLATISLMKLPNVWIPSQPLAVLLFVLCLGLPHLKSGDSHLWYWPLKLYITLLIGGVVAVLSSLFPGFSWSSWSTSRTDLRELRIYIYSGMSRRVV